jgi:hypothetical protein
MFNGVKRAGIVVCLIVPSVLLLPLHLALFGFPRALVHTFFGVMITIAIEDAMFLGYRKMPFACAYVPLQNPKLLWPAGVATFFLVSYGLASAARFAWQTPTRAILICVAASATILLTKLLDAMKRRDRFPVNFNEGPPSITSVWICSTNCRFANDGVHRVDPRPRWTRRNPLQLFDSAWSTA